MTEPTLVSPLLDASHSAHLDVTAIVVTRGHTEFLHETLAALSSQVRPADRVVVVDASDDAANGSLSGSLTAEFPSSWLWRGAPGAENFGDAVKRALADDGEIGLVSDSADPSSTFLWFLHDDSAPADSALAELLRAIDLSPSVAIAGCKQLDWTGELLREVGVSATRFGHRLPELDDQEVDQGQYDHREDVLAVGTAGMLIRSGVWDALRGTDPVLGPFEDGVDLCRRALLSGSRVIVVPEAVVRHAQAGYFGLRGRNVVVEVAEALGDEPQSEEPSIEEPGHEGFTGDSSRSFVARRRARLYLQAVIVPAPMVPLVLLWSVIAGVFRAAGRIALKEPGLATAEIVIPWTVLLRPGRIAAARRRASNSRRSPRRVLRPLEATWRDSFRVAQDRRLQKRALRGAKHLPNQIVLAERRAAARRRRTTFVVIILALIGVSIAFLHSVAATLFSGDAIVGGSLLPVDAGVAELWLGATSGWVDSGLGQSAWGDPLLLALIPLTLICANSAQLAVSVLVLGSFVFAGVGAWFASGELTRSLVLRTWAVAMWIAMPVTLLGVLSGRLGMIVTVVALPWVALGIGRAMHKGNSAGPVAAAAGAGLALAFACSGTPALLPLAVVIVVVIALCVPKRRSRMILVLLPVLVIMGPFVVAAIRNPRLWAATSGVPTPSDPVPAWQHLLGVPHGAAAWPWLPESVAGYGVLAVGGAAVIVALVGIFRRGGRGLAARIAWLVALLGGGVAIASSFAVVAAGSSDMVLGWAGAGCAVVVLGLLVAGLIGGDGLYHRLQGRSFGMLQLGAAVLAVVAVLAPVGSLAAQWWTSRTDGIELSAQAHDVAPAVAAHLSASGDRTRTLAISPATTAPADASSASRQVIAEVFDGASPDLTSVSMIVNAAGVVGPVWADSGTGAASNSGPRPAPADTAETRVQQLVADLTGGTGIDPGQQLIDLAIGAVVVPPANADATDLTRHERDALVTHLNSIPMLESVSDNAAGTSWRVAPLDGAGLDSLARPARARVLDSGGTTTQILTASPDEISGIVPDGPAGRVVVLSERAADGWTATLDGVNLQAIASQDGWSQAFQLPAQGGELSVVFDPPRRGLYLAVAAIVLIVVALLALPVRRRHVIDPGVSA